MGIRRSWPLGIALIIAIQARAQSTDLPLSHLNATPHDPLYTTYAAPLSRSEYFVDEAFHLNYYTPSEGVSYTTDTAGKFALGWRLDGKTAAIASKDFFRGPVIHRSYTDLVELEYWPFSNIQVGETFDVYSSRLAFDEVAVTNHDARAHEVLAYVYYLNPDGIRDAQLRDGKMVMFQHTEDAKNVSETPHPQYDPNFLDMLLLSRKADEWGSSSDLLKRLQDGSALDGAITGNLTGFVLAVKLKVGPGETERFRFVRGSIPMNDQTPLMRRAESGDVYSKHRVSLAYEGGNLLVQPLAPLIAESEAQYKNIPRIKLPSREYELAYWSAFNLVRQQMMPPEGKANYNYYVFSREPTWGWGHDGQVFHESMVMQAYALMDAKSAEASQRVFMERQRADGYIGYRVGPYVNRTFPLDGEDTSSAPFFNWTNWEIYRLSHDRQFLQQAYDSGGKFANWVLKTHEKDGDGFLEWGGNAMLECVRDSLDVIWSLFGGGDDTPKRVKSLDLTSMMVMETRSLAKMARELGKENEAGEWDRRADRMAELVRSRMWDPQDGFFYNLARDTGTFTTHEGISLKRKEIIGFLPLWAGIATKEQAARLREQVMDPSSFNRRYGVPTLAANDPYYEANITRCCQWNGAVWLLWDYMVMRGLQDYGYKTESETIMKHALDGVVFQLSHNHRFWESFSPDNTQLNSPKNYIWDAIIARMMIEVYGSQ